MESPPWNDRSASLRPDLARLHALLRSDDEPWFVGFGSAVVVVGLMHSARMLGRYEARKIARHGLDLDAYYHEESVAARAAGDRAAAGRRWAGAGAEEERWTSGLKKCL